MNHNEPSLNALAKILGYLIESAYELLKLTEYSAFDAAYKAIVKEIAPVQKLAKRRDLAQRLDNLLELLYEAERQHVKVLVASDQHSYRFAHAEEALAKAWELAAPEKSVYPVPFINEHDPVIQNLPNDYERLLAEAKEHGGGWHGYCKRCESKTTIFYGYCRLCKPLPKAQDRAILLRDFANDLKYPLFKGDTGIVSEYGDTLAFHSDRYNAYHTFMLAGNGLKMNILNCLEVIPTTPSLPTGTRVIVSSIFERLDGQHGTTSYFTGTHYVVDLIDKEGFADRLLLSPDNFEVVNPLPNGTKVLVNDPDWQDGATIKDHEWLDVFNMWNYWVEDSKGLGAWLNHNHFEVIEECPDCGLEVVIDEHICPVNPPVKPDFQSPDFQAWAIENEEFFILEADESIINEILNGGNE